MQVVNNLGIKYRAFHYIIRTLKPEDIIAHNNFMKEKEYSLRGVFIMGGRERMHKYEEITLHFYRPLFSVRWMNFLFLEVT